MDGDRVQAALAEMEVNRDIHVQWRDHFASCPIPGLCGECRAAADVAGDAETHQRHIDKYGRWIALLRDLTS